MIKEYKSLSYNVNIKLKADTQQSDFIRSIMCFKRVLTCLRFQIRQSAFLVTLTGITEMAWSSGPDGRPDRIRIVFLQTESDLQSDVSPAVTPSRAAPVALDPGDWRRCGGVIAPQRHSVLDRKSWLELSVLDCSPCTLVAALKL